MNSSPPDRQINCKYPLVSFLCFQIVIRSLWLNNYRKLIDKGDWFYLQGPERISWVQQLLILCFAFTGNCAVLISYCYASGFYLEFLKKYHIGDTLGEYWIHYNFSCSCQKDWRCSTVRCRWVECGALWIRSSKIQWDVLTAYSQNARFEAAHSKGIVLKSSINIIVTL